MAFPPSSAPQSGTNDTQSDFRADMDVLNDEALPETGADDEGAADLEELNSEDEPGTDDATDSAEEEEVEEETTEEEEEVEGAKKDDDKKVVPLHRRPTVKEITAKFPDFFKQFPDVRHAMFREQEFTSLFPTVDDAKEAANNAESFGHFSNLIQSGKPEDFKEFLSGVSQAGGLTSMAANFLPSLYAADKDMYFKVTTPIGAAMVRNAYKAAKQAGNEDLANAALHIAQFALGDQAFATGDKLPEAIQPSTGDPKISEERKAFYNERYQEAQTYVSSTANTRLRAEIRKGLDPNGVFNEFTTNLLVDKIVREIGDVLDKDDRHMKSMNSLWKHAYQAGIAGNWKDRILSAYLSAAKAQMPAIRATIRSQAMADKKRQVDQRSATAGKSANRKDIPGSGNATGRRSTGRAASAREIDWGKTSDLDILNDREVLKRK